MFELFMYVYSCNALLARFFAVDRALNSYVMIMIMIIELTTKIFFNCQQLYLETYVAKRPSRCTDFLIWSRRACSRLWVGFTFHASFMSSFFFFTRSLSSPCSLSYSSSHVENISKHAPITCDHPHSVLPVTSMQPSQTQHTHSFFIEIRMQTK